VRYLRALRLAGRAVTGYLGGWITEGEARGMINEARAMTGRAPMGGGTR
jgi:hypothetical protein